MGISQKVTDLGYATANKRPVSTKVEGEDQGDCPLTFTYVPRHPQVHSGACGGRGAVHKKLRTSFLETMAYRF